jgi:allantoicase
LSGRALKDPSKIPAASWTEILPRSPLRPGAQNLFAVANAGRWTHVRLNIFPDGGVARLKVYGEVMPDPRLGASKVPIDLAAAGNGGMVVAASDMFFGSKENLIMPGRAANMGDGWETRRRRGPGHDWAVLRLAFPGTIGRIELDTNHFKGNYPDRCTIEVCHARGAVVDALTCHDLKWNVILPMTKLHAHRRHFFARQLAEHWTATHVRLNIFPDGGVSRLRVWGVPSSR